jgi:16S rRNA G966 N2-methylase RsmD
LKQYIYTYVQHIDERDLALLEQRAFFGTCNEGNIVFSSVCVDPSRSPFMRERIEILESAVSIEALAKKMSTHSAGAKTFRVQCVNDIAFGETGKLPHAERRQAEREIALTIDGEPELNSPELQYGLLYYAGEWHIGYYTKSESVWLTHVQKPQSYSTALSTRVARTIANIAAPVVEDVRLIDPCCGIGTVIVEALSMGMNIVGRDVSPFVCMGARKNIEHFGYETIVTKGPIQEVVEHYDVAIIDLPYNVFTAASRDDQLDIIRHAHRIADKVVIVTIENIDDLIQGVGMKIVDRGIARKQSFEREILVCK